MKQITRLSLLIILMIVTFSILIAITVFAGGRSIQGRMYSKKAPLQLGVIKELPKHKQTLLATITAYTAVETCDTHCTMASGKKAYIGAVACPRRLPLGTKVRIDGKEYTCEDRTALRVDGRFDLFFGYTQTDYKHALHFGKQQLMVEVL